LLALWLESVADGTACALKTWPEMTQSDKTVGILVRYATEEDMDSRQVTA